jgi:hypothetical protein
MRAYSHLKRDQSYMQMILEKDFIYNLFQKKKKKETERGEIGHLKSDQSIMTSTYL